MTPKRPLAFLLAWAVLASYTGVLAWAAEELTSAEEAIAAAEERPAGGAFTDPTASEEAAAADPEGEQSQELVPSTLGLNERVSLDLRSIEVAEALRFLAVKGGINMAISKSVSGRVQLLLNNVAIKDILDLVLITNGLAYERIGDIYYVMTEQEYKERYGKKFSDTRQVRIFKLRYAVPEQAFALFEVLKSEIGRLLVDPESGTVLVMDSTENIQRMEASLRALEERKAVKVYELKYAKAIDVETRLKTRLDNKKVGLVSADERTNSVIVETLPERMQEIDAIVKSLDQKTREVLIDAKIVKVTMTNEDHKEIRWEGFFEALGPNGQWFIGNHGLNALARTGESFLDDFVEIPVTARPTAGAKNQVGEKIVFGNLGENSFETLLNFLKKYGDTKVLSNPKLAVINNQEAKIHVGEKQAYVTTTTTTGQTTTTTAESVTFIDVGIQLNVTPTINEDGFVTMKIKPEISSVVDTLTTPSGNAIPIVDSSLAETTVMVKDGVSILIGGLRREEKVSERNKLPILGDIPIIGLPFNSSSETKVTTELLILLTPHVVYGDTLVSGDRKAGESPFMSYMDYPATAEEASRGQAVAPPARVAK